ncbi:tetrahydrofolate dehydrogenase/cyclohydrolase catalytic domain-containing protein [Eubacteriales bacterium mix99]
MILKGSEVSRAMKDRAAADVDRLKRKGVFPHLALVRLGDRPDDRIYERSAIKKCEGWGIRCTVFSYPEDTSQEKLIREIKKLNQDASIHGILVFRPLPRHMREETVQYAMDPEKDVDCFSPVNVAKVFEGDGSGFAPCTPEAVLEILDFYRIPIEGKNIVIVGRSMVVGRPVAMLLLQRHGTVTICHTRTANRSEICRNAELLVAAAGRPGLITSDDVGQGAAVIDVGTNVDERGNLCGDVCFDEVRAKAGFLTPVPGGVGTVTTSVLARHVVQAAMKACGENR